MQILWLVILGSTGSEASPPRSSRYLVPTSDWKEALRVFGDHIGRNGELYAEIRSEHAHCSLDEDLELLRSWASKGLPRNWDAADAWPARIVAMPAGEPFPLHNLSGGEPIVHELGDGWWAGCIGGVVVNFARSEELAEAFSGISHNYQDQYTPERLRRAWVLVEDVDDVWHVGRGAERFGRYTPFLRALEAVKRQVREGDEILRFSRQTRTIGTIRARKSFPSGESKEVDALPPTPVRTPSTAPVSPGFDPSKLF